MRFKLLNLLIFIFVLSFLAFPLVASAAEYLPLVPCGLNPPRDNDGNILPKPWPLADSYYESCTRCDTFRLIDNVFHFVLEGIVPPVAAVLFIFAGLMILLGGAIPARIALGKTIFKNTFIGLLIILSAWLVANTFIKSFVPGQAADAPWYRLVCDPTTGFVGVGGPPPAPGVAPGQAEAQALINRIGLGSFSTAADCGNSFHARQNIQDIAAGKFPAVCSPSCNCKVGGLVGNISVNKSILEGLLGLANRGIRFTVTSFTTGKHSVDSRHYQGRAVDIMVSGNPIIWIESRTFLNSLGGSAFCEAGDGAVVQDCNASQTSHIHWQI